MNGIERFLQEWENREVRVIYIEDDGSFIPIYGTLINTENGVYGLKIGDGMSSSLLFATGMVTNILETTPPPLQIFVNQTQGEVE